MLENLRPAWSYKNPKSLIKKFIWKYFNPINVCDDSAAESVA